MAPCLYIPNYGAQGMTDYVDVWGTLEAEGVYKYGDPNKELDKKKVCEGTAAGVTAEARAKACELFTYMNELSTIGVKSSKYYG